MRYVVIDTETTGMEPPADKIVELAGVWRASGDEQLVYHSLCNPGRDIPPTAKAVHHITEHDVASAPSPGTVLEQMKAHMGRTIFAAGGAEQYVVVAHNAAFDQQFIQQLDEIMGSAPWICTWRCAMHIWPDAPSHSNQVLRYWLDLQVALPPDLYPHRALYDTLVTEAILRRMLETHTLEELLHLTTQPVLLETCRFGKHRGTPWREVPRDYLQWVLRQGDMDADVRHTAAHWLRPQGQLL